MATRLDDFRALVESLIRDVPAEFRAGIVAIDVSPQTVPHPVRGNVYTLGECIPLEWSGSGADLQSRIVLYHGSFAALARLGEFAWREEAWETLAHELRHHLEWRARADALGAYDWAADENFKRDEGLPFDPTFYRSGELVVAGVYKVGDDVFIEAARTAARGQRCDIVWHGRHYRVMIPPAARRVALFLTLLGLAEPPLGEAVLVVRHKPSLLDLCRPGAAALQHHVTVEPRDG